MLVDVDSMMAANVMLAALNLSVHHVHCLLEEEFESP